MSAPEPRIRGAEVRRVTKEGELVAVLTSRDHGSTYTVVTEVYPRGGGHPVSRRPYTFPDAESGRAFVAETATAFTYLGCEIRSD